MTKVKFLREANGQILAVFPLQKEYGTAGIRTSEEVLLACYSHVGQHSVTSRQYAKDLKPATRREFEPLLEELQSVGYDDLQIVLPSKKAFKEALRADPYTSVGFGSKVTTWVLFWDWDPGVYGGRSAGYKFGCCASGVRKTDLVNQFYDYLFVNGIHPDYSRLKIAETDEQRFKVPIALNW